MHWLNISYNDPEVRRRVEAICGKPFGLWSALCRGGTGSPRSLLVDGSPALLAPFTRQEDRRTLSIEVRQRGLLLRCRDRLETMGLPLSFAMIDAMRMIDPSGTGPGTIRFDLAEGHELVIGVDAGHWTSIVRLLQGGLPRNKLSAP